MKISDLHCECGSGLPILSLQPGYDGESVVLPGFRRRRRVKVFIREPIEDKAWCARCIPKREALEAAD